MLRKFRAKILLATFILVIGVCAVINFTKNSYHPVAIKLNTDIHPIHAHQETPQIHQPPQHVQPQHDGTLDTRQAALEMNLSQRVHNLAEFGPPPARGIVAVVQVHSRISFFEQLLKSLEKAKGIEQVTLVISMDKNDPKLFQLIDTIKFCRYITIFFPFSMQLYPDSFPGEDPNDCPRNLARADAIKRKCNNAEYPDMYGHYREVKFVQIKHHWLWKLHTVFNGLKSIANTDSTVLLLEEDYYVLPDVFQVMRLSLETVSKSCPECKAISLGNYEQETTDYRTESGNAVVRAWVSSKNNIGMVVTKQFYQQIVACNDAFCSYDDYNWDWTLQGIAPSCMTGGSFTGLFLTASRVLHLGSCGGIHTNAGKRGCDPEKLAAKAMLNIADANLHPDEVTVTAKIARPANKPYINGGWGDKRDHQLCKSYYNLSRDTAKLRTK